jgi:hypothetical protein
MILTTTTVSIILALALVGFKELGFAVPDQVRILTGKKSTKAVKRAWAASVGSGKRQPSP